MAQSLIEQGRNRASLLKPFDTEKMDAYVIRNDFLKKSPNDPTIVQRA